MFQAYLIVKINVAHASEPEILRKDNLRTFHVHNSKGVLSTTLDIPFKCGVPSGVLGVVRSE